MKTLPLACLFVLFSLWACAPAATPVPTTDPAVIQTQAALSIFATQTASVPTATQTPDATAIPTATATMQATASPMNTATPLLSIPPRGKYKHPYQIKEDYNKIKDQTIVSLNPLGTEFRVGVGGLFADYLYPGTTPQQPNIVYFSFVSSADSWQFLKCYDLAFLLNGTTRLQPKTLHDGDVHSGYVIEYVSTILPLRDFLTIVNAKTVEGSVCNKSFTLTSEQMDGLRDVASRMQP